LFTKFKFLIEQYFIPKEKNMKFKFFNVLASVSFIFLFNVFTANAQFSLPKIPKIKQTQTTNTNNSQGNTNGKSPLVYDKPFPPSIIAGDFMRNIVINVGGNLVISNFEAAFLPDKDASGKDVFYAPDQNNHSFTGVISKGGEKIHDLTFRASFRPMNRIYWQVEAIGNVLKLKGAGNYNLEMFLDGKKFQEFPFVVKDGKGNDPYSAMSFLYIALPFEDYGFLSKGMPNQNTFSSLSEETSTYWNFWLANPDASQRKKVNVKAELFKDGKVIAKNAAAGTDSFINEKSVENLNIVLATLQSKPFYIKRDLLSSDGNCEIVVTVTGLSATPTKTSYPFSVKNGQIVPNGRGNRETTDAVRFFESGNAMFMIGRKGTVN